MESNGQGWDTWSSLVEMWNFCGSLIVAILSGSEFQSFICPGEERMFVTVFAGVDGIVCFAIEMSSATQNGLKISDG